MPHASFSDLAGKTIASIDGLAEGSESVTFHLEGGLIYRLSHVQDCCESCAIAELHGASADELAGAVIAMAVESSNSEDQPSEWSESWTWTFYRLITNKGTVVMRWLGESNGYYAEGVDFERVDS